MPQDVYVVDDDESNRETLWVALDDMGYRVAEAADGATARDHLHASPGRLVVLLDLMLHGLDGAGLLQAAREDAMLARHAYILMTASPQKITPEVRDLLTTLDVPVIEKPFDLDMLFDTLEQACQRLNRTPS